MDAGDPGHLRTGGGGVGGAALQHRENADNSKDTFCFSIPGAYLTQLLFLCHIFYELNCVPPKFMC